MRIKDIKATNFKSLVDFTISLSKFNCLIGLNGSGKSTVLQFIDFLSQQMHGGIKGWLEERHWSASDMNSKLSSKKNIGLFVELTRDDGSGCFWWEASFNTTQLHCTTETIKTPDARLEVKNGELRIVELQEGHPNRELMNEEISFSYEGSVLSQLKEKAVPQSILALKNFFVTAKSLDLLSPEHLRTRTRASSGSLGLGGQNLSAFLHEMGDQKRLDLIERLKRAYPHLQGLHAKSLRSGWKQIEISEEYEGPGTGFFPEMVTEARHINDGMLRLIAILAELQSDYRFLLFDEIENGINPELVEFVLEELVTSPKQIMVTTHSPMILNYLSDDVARSGVLYLYKTRDGHTHSIPFFSIPSLAEKLTVMGPGEAFVDTNLTALGEEIEAITEAE